MQIEWNGKRVLVTGASGFLGKHLVGHLRSQEARVLTPPTDLCSPGAAMSMIDNHGPLDCVFHLAGYNGGIEFNRRFPADVFYRNTVMGLNVLEACKAHGVKRVVSVVASCAYGEFEWVSTGSFGDSYECHKQIMTEKDFLDGQPHDSVACHGYAKRNLQLASKFYREQYGLDAVCVCPTTLYGPGDSLDPQRTKVLGAMVKRFVEATRDNLPSVTCWGSGTPLREFLYVEDAAKLIARSALVYDDSSLPLNLGTGQEHSIENLARATASLAGYTGTIHWDTSKPDGQHRKRLDLTRMQQYLPDFLPTSLPHGLQLTVDWAREQLCG